MKNSVKLQLAANSLSIPVQEFFVDEGVDALPMAVEEKLLLDSYRAIPSKEIQASILKITANGTRHGE
jgi:hypothetical protein